MKQSKKNVADREWLLAPVFEYLKEMEKRLMSQIDDLKTEIDAEDVQVQTLVASAKKIDADIVALIAKAKAGASPQDIAAQLTLIQAHTAVLASVNANMVADDASANG